jgi:hypothetical protein
LAFTVAFAAVGSTTWVASIVLVQRRLLRDAAIFAIPYVAVVIALAYLATHSVALPAAVSLAGLMALYHSTFFTAAFSVGALASARAAFMAAAIEGGLGFSTFIVLRILHVA